MEKAVERWWKLAELDFNNAEKNISIKAYYVSVFLCQQAIEKALKALWIKERTNEEIPKYHNLLFFFRELKLPTKFKSTCEDLTGAYITTRYPTGLEAEFSKLDAEVLLRKGKEILEWIKERL
ncbi:MAG: HEPN domain-containing protein [Nanoarchaeota archaeon]